MKRNKIIVVCVLIVVSLLLIGFGIYVCLNNADFSKKNSSNITDNLNNNKLGNSVEQDNNISLGDVSGLSNIDIEKKVNDVFGNENSKYVIKNVDEKEIIFSNVDSNDKNMNIECNYNFELNDFWCYNTTPSEAIKTE